MMKTMVAKSDFVDDFESRLLGVMRDEAAVVSGGWCFFLRGVVVPYLADHERCGG